MSLEGNESFTKVLGFGCKCLSKLQNIEKAIKKWNLIMTLTLYRGIKRGASVGDYQQFSDMEQVAIKFAGEGGTIVSIAMDLKEAEDYKPTVSSEAINIGSDKFIRMSYYNYQIPSVDLEENSKRWYKREVSVEEFKSERGLGEARK